MNFGGKVVLVTGASSGIGKAIVRELAKEECRIVLLARRIELLEGLTDEFRLDGERVLNLMCDVSKKDEVASAYKKIKEKFGGVDVAILNAGYGHEVTIKNYNSKFAEDTFGANIFGLVYWVEQLLPEFIDKREGVIAGMSSLADNRGYSGSGFYCASKAAASVYLEGLRIECKPKGIKVITVKPGFVRTPMTDKNRFSMPMLMEPDKAARIILDGIKKEKKIIQFPWQIALAARIIGALPDNLYEWLAGKQKEK